MVIGEEIPKSPKGTLRNNNEINNMQEIVNINISEIQDFPTQREIYGEPIIELEFLASVKEFGVITPVIVTKGTDCYILISGHRRVKAAELAELTTVPAIIREYDSTDDMQLEFLSCNMQREKTPRVRINEFLRYKQLLCQIGKVRKKSRNYENTIFENTMFSRILDENIKNSNDGEFSIDSTEILKQVTGYSEYEQTYLSVLYNDDWLQKKLDGLRLLGCSVEIEEVLISLREKAVQEYEAGNATLNNAVSEVKRVFKDAEAHLKPKEEKKPKKDSTLASQEGNFKKPMKLALQLPGVKATCKYSETPLLYDEEKSVCEFFFKSGGFTFGFITTLERPVGICCETPNGIVMINSERLAELVRKEVGIKE